MKEKLRKTLNVIKFVFFYVKTENSKKNTGKCSVHVVSLNYVTRGHPIGAFVVTDLRKMVFKIKQKLL